MQFGGKTDEMLDLKVKAWVAVLFASVLPGAPPSNAGELPSVCLKVYGRGFANANVTILHTWRTAVRGTGQTGGHSPKPRSFTQRTRRGAAFRVKSLSLRGKILLCDLKLVC